MTKKELKKLAGNTVMESEYSNSAKKQLLNFILNEASDAQIKALILDGDIERLEEDAAQFIEKRFKIAQENDIKDFVNFAKEEICEMLGEQKHTPDMLKKMTNFVMNEASDYQVLSMIFEGILPDETINEQKKYEYYNFINESKWGTGSAIGTGIVGGVGAAAGAYGGGPWALVGAVAAAIAYTAYQVYRKTLNMYGKKCETFKDPEDRKKCMKNARNSAVKQQISVLKSGMNKCKKSKDPVKCSEIIKKKIIEIQDKLE